MEDVILEDAEAGWLNMDVELAEGEAAGWPNAKDDCCPNGVVDDAGDDDGRLKTKVEPEADAEEAGD